MEVKENYKGFEITCRQNAFGTWTVTLFSNDWSLQGKLGPGAAAFTENQSCADGIAEAKRRIDAA